MADLQTVQRMLPDAVPSCGRTVTAAIRKAQALSLYFRDLATWSIVIRCTAVNTSLALLTKGSLLFSQQYPSSQ